MGRERTWGTYDVRLQRKDTRFDRSHFQKHGAASLNFETVYYVLSADFNKYMDIQQAINVGLHRKFAELGIEFDLPDAETVRDVAGPGAAGAAEKGGVIAVRGAVMTQMRLTCCCQ